MDSTPTWLWLMKYQDTHGYSSPKPWNHQSAWLAFSWPFMSTNVGNWLEARNGEQLPSKSITTLWNALVLIAPHRIDKLKCKCHDNTYISVRCWTHDMILVGYSTAHELTRGLIVSLKIHPMRHDGMKNQFSAHWDCLGLGCVLTWLAKFLWNGTGMTLLDIHWIYMLFWY